MAARQLAGRRPLYFTADVSIILLTFFFSSPSLGGFWADRHQTLPQLCSVVTVIFKIQSEIWGPSPKHLVAQTSKFRISQFDREYLRTASRYREQKKALKTAITPLQVYQIR